MNIDFLLKILAYDSTTGKEEQLADYLISNLNPPGASISIQKLYNGKKNIFFKWGRPKVVFCTHIDTVPPFIPPRHNKKTIFGRGSCDAKGQLAAMYQACLDLADAGNKDFGLLLLSGEEIGTYGAKEANEWVLGSKFVIIGEPTENKLISAAKGTMLFAITIKGKSAHSGYPENGVDACEKLRSFLNQLAKLKFKKDRVLGKTTYNVGDLKSANAHNVVPDKITFKLFFRTTFTTHDCIEFDLKKLASSCVEIKTIHADMPMLFHTEEGFATGVVAYGSDAPKLNKLGGRLLYGAGSILSAHSDNEHVKIADLKRAVTDLKLIYKKLQRWL